MSQSYLPSRENLSIFAGDLYFQPDGANRARSMGFVESFAWTPSVEIEDVFNANDGIRTKIDEMITEVSVEISMTLQETTITNMAYAMQGKVVDLVQAAQTGTEILSSDVYPGEMVDLGALNVSTVTVSDGTNTLINGVDYVLFAEAGIVSARKAHATFNITFDAPEITNADNKQVIEVLSNQEGISGVFHVIGRNEKGRRYAFRSFRATLKPSGEVQLLSDGSGLQKVELTGSGIRNEALPLTPWGILQALN